MKYLISVLALALVVSCQKQVEEKVKSLTAPAAKKEEKVVDLGTDDGSDDNVKEEEVKLSPHKYINDYAQKDGVIVSKSGLAYRVVRPGGDKKPTKSNHVVVHYEGKLTNGTVFDSSYQRGEKIAFGLGQVIKGWTEGLQYIGEGGEVELVIPPELAYGARAVGDLIPANSILVFKVELFEIR